MIPFLGLLAFWWFCSGVVTLVAAVGWMGSSFESTPWPYDTPEQKVRRATAPAKWAKALLISGSAFMALGSLYMILGSANS